MSTIQDLITESAKPHVRKITNTLVDLSLALEAAVAEGFTVSILSPNTAGNMQDPVRVMVEQRLVEIITAGDLLVVLKYAASVRQET